MSFLRRKFLGSKNAVGFSRVFRDDFCWGLLQGLGLPFSGESAFSFLGLDDLVPFFCDLTTLLRIPWMHHASRLWCTFELATFLHLGGTDRQAQFETDDLEIL